MGCPGWAGDRRVIRDDCTVEGRGFGSGRIRCQNERMLPAGHY